MQINGWTIRALLAACALSGLHAPIANACNAQTTNIGGKCQLEQTGLSGLFRSAPAGKPLPSNNIETAQGGMFLPYSRVVEDLPQPVQTTLVSLPKAPAYSAPIQEGQEPQKKKSTAPHDLPVFGKSSDLLVFKSSNKRLTKGGHDGQAILMMRCRAGKLHILLDFPGYPMSGSTTQKSITYQFDAGQKQAMHVGNSNQMSVVGVWEAGQAKQFAKRLISSKAVAVFTKDDEQNAIAAQFELGQQAAKIGSFKQSCNSLRT